MREQGYRKLLIGFEIQVNKFLATSVTKKLDHNINVFPVLYLPSMFLDCCHLE